MNKRAKSTKNANSSETATSSFEAIFGKGLTEEQATFRRRLETQDQVVKSLEAMQVPPTVLARTIHKGKLERARKTLTQLQEHNEWLAKQ